LRRIGIRVFVQTFVDGALRDAGTTWPTTYTFQDPFNTKNTTAWTWSSSQTVPYNDGGNNVVKSTGTGSNWNANFYRTTSLGTGQGLQVRFKVDAANTQALFAIETSDSSRRFAVSAQAGKLVVQYNDGGGWRYPVDLLASLALNTWYVLRIVVDDVRGGYIEAYQESAPAVRGSYQQWLPTGLSWRFRHWIYSGTAYLDDYREFSASGLTWNGDERENFGYDPLDRLLSAASDSGAQGYTESYTYLANGNLATRNSLTYRYETAHPHAVVGLDSAGLPFGQYQYDANGNTIQKTQG